MVIHAGQHCGAGGGGSGVYKIDTIKLVIAGNSIGVDLRGASASARERAARGDAASRAPHTTTNPVARVGGSRARRSPRPLSAGAALPTPKPRPVMTLMWHPDGFTQSDLHKVMEKAYQWSYARNIGVLSRVVCFTLDEMDPDYVSAHPEFQEGSDHVPNEGEISSVVRRVVLRHGPIDRALTRTTRARARALPLRASRAQRLGRARRVPRVHPGGLRRVERRPPRAAHRAPPAFVIEAVRRHSAA